MNVYYHGQKVGGNIKSGQEENITNTIMNMKDRIMAMPMTNIVLLVVLVMIITLMLINTWFNNSIIQWFVWILLFFYLTFFITIKFYLVENDTFDPWSSALIASLFIFLFPSPLFNTRKNKNSTKYLSIFFAAILLLSTFLMISSLTSSYFAGAHPSDTTIMVVLKNYLPLIILAYPGISYWTYFY